MSERNESKERLKWFANSISRRGFGKLLFKVGVGLVGAAAGIDALPIDKSGPRTAEAAVSCSTWYLCGMHGAPCDSCGGNLYSCPAGSVTGGSWSRCCRRDIYSSRIVTYVDCCGKTGGCNNWCSNTNEPNWCNNAGGNLYFCTLALIGSTSC